MELSAALGAKRLDANSPYNPNTWHRLLDSASLSSKYPNLSHNLQFGFNAHVPHISRTFSPPNRPSVLVHHMEFKHIIKAEFEKGRYLGPFTKNEIEAHIGPFQTSPLSIIPKPGKPGKFRLIQNLSFPHSPRNGISSINSAIDSDLFPCTWGTFSIICLLVHRLPPGSQAAIWDVKEAYRTIPLAPSQWPGMVVRLQADDSFAIDTRNCFGLASSGGCYGIIGDAGTQLMRARGIGPVSKWVDDHLFLCILRKHIQTCNRQRESCAIDISANGGELHDGGRLWFKGAIMSDDRSEEFDEDCKKPIQDLSNRSLRSEEDSHYSYSLADIDEISKELGIPWELEKDIPFQTEVPFGGFLWNLAQLMVSLPDTKKAQYLQAIYIFESHRTHTLEDAQKLYGKLLHTCHVVPSGRAYLTSLERFMAIFGESPFMPRSAPHSTPNDLLWWKQTLSCTILSRSIPGPKVLIDLSAVGANLVCLGLPKVE